MLIDVDVVDVNWCWYNVVDVNVVDVDVDVVDVNVVDVNDVVDVDVVDCCWLMLMLMWVCMQWEMHMIKWVIYCYTWCYTVTHGVMLCYTVTNGVNCFVSQFRTLVSI